MPKKVAGGSRGTHAKAHHPARGAFPPHHSTVSSGKISGIVVSGVEGERAMAEGRIQADPVHRIAVGSSPMRATEKHAFTAHKLAKALVALINDDTQRELLGRFRATVEYRSKFRALGEGGGLRTEKDPIAYAIKSALSSYGAHVSQGDLDSRLPSREVDSDFKKRYEHAAQAAARDRSVIENFIGLLDKNHVRVNKLSPTELENEIAKAFHVYTAKVEIGATIDPY